MLTLALLVVVVQTGTRPPAPSARRWPVSVLSRSETSMTGGPRLRLLVQIDSPAAASDLRIADLMENVRTIWRPYADIDFGGIEVEAAANHDDQLRLLITERPQRPGQVAGAALGWIEFLDGRPRNTITVSIAAARTLMHQAKWLGRPIETLPPTLRQRFVTRALSRSAAHEIGHYLLRSSSHAVRGLMRERMTIEEIMDDGPALNRLLPGEIASLNQRLAGAQAEASAPDTRPSNTPRETLQASFIAKTSAHLLDPCGVRCSAHGREVTSGRLPRSHTGYPSAVISR
jgi:hypothetical protein